MLKLQIIAVTIGMYPYIEYEKPHCPAELEPRVFWVYYIKKNLATLPAGQTPVKKRLTLWM
jgi:hypothetical protein